METRLKIIILKVTSVYNMSLDQLQWNQQKFNRNGTFCSVCHFSLTVITKIQSFWQLTSVQRLHVICLILVKSIHWTLNKFSIQLSSLNRLYKASYHIFGVLATPDETIIITCLKLLLVIKSAARLVQIFHGLRITIIINAAAWSVEF